ncbi:MAG TPA: TldD/PmbA family protein, partial [Clostridia bacterium]|nr:TldD/PmbA family protein [Clostridia bacterium]
MLDKNQLEEILSRALENGGEFAEIFVEGRRNSGISCEENQIERIVSGLDAGAGIRIISGESTAYGFTNDLSLPGILKVAEVVAKASRTSKKDIVLDLRRLPPEITFPVEKSPDEIPVDDKVSLVMKANEAARNLDSRIRQVTVGYGDVIQEVLIANSDGFYVEDRRIRTRLAINAVAVERGIIQTGYESAGGNVGYELFQQTSPIELGEKAARRALL